MHVAIFFIALYVQGRERVFAYMRQYFLAWYEGTHCWVSRKHKV